MAPRSGRVDAAIGLVALGILLVGCFVVLRPFLAAVLWALVLAIALWPVFRWLEARVHGQRGLAAALVTGVLVVLLLGPAALLGVAAAGHIEGLATVVRRLLEQGPPPPPGWAGELPVIGPDLAAAWAEMSDDADRFAEAVAARVPAARAWLLSLAARLGGGILELVLSLVIAFFMLRDGAGAAGQTRAVGERVAGERADQLIRVAEGTMRGVVYGILGTALAQGALAAVGLWLAGVPGPLLLGVLVALLSVLPAGPALILLPAVLSLFVAGEVGWGVFLLVWSVLAVGGVDNVIKPYFIGRGSALPLLLVFLGIFGGAIAFGFLGIFLGPTLLAVGYALMRAWAPAGRGGAPEPPARAAA